jgi:hypothetical protein
MVANVCSWCGSRLGASAPMAARRTPPRRDYTDAADRNREDNDDD